MNKQCNNCQYWKPSGMTNDVIMGACRKNAPMPVVPAIPVPTGQVMPGVRFIGMQSFWPATAETDFCGEHSLKVVMKLEEKN